MGYSPWGCKESDTIGATEHACTGLFILSLVQGHLCCFQFSVVTNKAAHAFDLEADLFASLCHTTFSALLIWVEILWERKFSFC